MKLLALIDSNVIVAALAEAHVHHEPSFALFREADPGALAIAAHSYAEAYAVLTRKGERASFEFTSSEAWAALEGVRAVTTVIGLTPNQTLDAVSDYSRSGGVGARLYDKLIGATAVANAIPVIVTWNIRHMQSLFPHLEVVRPTEFLSAPAGN